MNKKGNMKDVPDAILIVFGIVFVLFIMYTINSNFLTTVSSNNATNMTSVIEDATTYNNRFISGWDFGFFFMLLLFPVFSFIAARKIPSTPLLMIIVFFVLGFIILLGAIIANFHGAMLENGSYETFVNTTIFIKLLMPKLFFYSIIYTFIVIIGLFGKPEGSL